MSSESIEDIKIDSVRKESENYRIKSYVVFLIVFAIILMFLVFLGRIGNDFFGLMIFLIIFIIPVIILFRNKLPKLLPEFITNSLYEIDDDLANSQPIYSVSQQTKEYAYLFSFVVLIIGSIVLIADYRKQLEDKMSVFKILGSLVCLIFAGIMLSNITGEELKITDSDDHELSSEN